MDTTDRTSDEQLIRRVRAGELAALEALFERHSGAMYGFFYRTTGSAATAEDLTQDVFLRVLRYRASFRAGGVFRVWLYRIARNVLADHRAQPAPDVALDELDAEPPETTPSATARLEQDETRVLVRTALARLGASDRELVILCRFHELRHAELAELFDCSVGAIKVRVHRALKRLGEAIAASGAEVRR